MKYCTNCGKPVEDNDKFCEYCGAPALEEEIDAPPPKPKVQPPKPKAKPPTPNTQPPTPNTQPPTPNTQPPTPNSQPPTPNSFPPPPNNFPPTQQEGNNKKPIVLIVAAVVVILALVGGYLGYTKYHDSKVEEAKELQKQYEQDVNNAQKAKSAEEKQKEYENRLNKSNEALKQKNELVYLPGSVKKTGKHEVTIEGFFYNNTKETISGVAGMLVDVTLRDYDKEIGVVKDVQYNNPELENVSIAPGATLTHSITVQVETADKNFDNFDVSVHKIRWKVRKKVAK